ncbi:hypothetical protein G9F32_02105 [Acinetobacter sp. 194]|uniref:hypothetical protein n=1 Tax=Acinetobacter shaoyimingii TaxID=2715164 RepID=UPI00140CE50B|nr:hypothetical protein [Acinetobacter shaoyimingii]NHB56829.1 hypothetical protein [Acinetobacter shaoyimingii]
MSAVNKSQSLSLKFEHLAKAPSIYRYFPKTRYTPNQEYQVTTKTNDFYQFNPDDYKFEIKTLPNLPKLKWIEKPHFLGYNITPENAQFDQSGELIFSFQTNQDPNDYLILIHATNITKLGNSNSFILSPYKDSESKQSFKSYISFGYHMCQHLVNFDENDQILLKFDLVSHDGKVIPWQDDPIKISIQKTLQEQNTTSKNLSWYQKIWNWITKILFKIFQ